MINLIVKDLLIQKKQLLISFIYIPFVIFAFQTLGPAMYSAGVVAFTYILVTTSCAFEDKNKADIMLNSLPINRSNIIAAKYLSALVYFIMGTLTYVLVTEVLSISKVSINTFPLGLDAFVGGIVAVSLMIGIYLPVFFKLGYMKSKIFTFILFFVSFFGVTSLVEALQSGNNSILSGSMANFLESQQHGVIVLLIAVIVLIFMFISYGISVKVYKQREF